MTSEIRAVQLIAGDDLPAETPEIRAVLLAVGDDLPLGVPEIRALSFVVCDDDVAFYTAPPAGGSSNRLGLGLPTRLGL